MDALLLRSFRTTMRQPAVPQWEKVSVNVRGGPVRRSNCLGPNALVQSSAAQAAGKSEMIRPVASKHARKCFLPMRASCIGWRRLAMLIKDGRRKGGGRGAG